MPPRRLAAEWVLPVEGPPIHHGAALVGDDGRLSAVGSDLDLPHPPGVPAETLADAVLLPGLVNAHTHLELTGLDDRISEPTFPGWIRRLIDLKASRSPQQFLDAARQGLRDCYAAGVTTIADTGDSGAVIEVLSEFGGSGIAYVEVFGPDPAESEARFTAFRQRVSDLTRFSSHRVTLGVSPHAPYSVSGSLYAAVAAWAKRNAIPIAVHIAESRAEAQLLTQAAGPFAESWRDRGIPLPPLPGRSPLEWLEQHGVLGPRTLCIHVVHAAPADLTALGRHGCGVAHCPRSNERHGHGAAPLTGFLQEGLAVGVGTDSVASVSPLDLLAEARAARKNGGLSAGQALELCTIGAARAIGLASEIGSLDPGKWGDLAAFRLPQGVDEAHLADTVLARQRTDLLATYLAGRPVFRGNAL